jgi:hypothetical protein
MSDDVILVAGTIVEMETGSIGSGIWQVVPKITGMGATGDMADPKEKTTLSDKKKKYGDSLPDALDKNLSAQYIPFQDVGDDHYDDYVLQQAFITRCQNREEFNIRVKWPDNDVNGFLWKSLGFQWDEATQEDWKMFTVNGKQNSFCIMDVNLSGTATVAAAATTQLTASWVPMLENEPGTILWSSSDEAVATVDTAGLVTGVSAGTATITAEIRGVPGTLEVTVS